MSAKGKAKYLKHVIKRRQTLHVSPTHKPWEKLTEAQQAEFEPKPKTKAAAKKAAS